jgi:hypothetical protein
MENKIGKNKENKEEERVNLKIKNYYTIKFLYII